MVDDARVQTISIQSSSPESTFPAIDITVYPGSALLDNVGLTCPLAKAYCAVFGLHPDKIGAVPGEVGSMCSRVNGRIELFSHSDSASGCCCIHACCETEWGGCMKYGNGLSRVIFGSNLHVLPAVTLFDIFPHVKLMDGFDQFNLGAMIRFLDTCVCQRHG